MASKNELLEIIRDNGLSGNASMTKAELQEIVDRLRPARPGEDDNQQDDNQQDDNQQDDNQQDDNQQDDNQQDDDEKNGEEKTTDFFNELNEKIKGAEAPSPKPPKGETPIIEKKKKKAKKGESNPDSFRIQGYLLLLATDTVFPTALSFANNMLDKKRKITVDQLKLNDKDFASLEPLADQAADYMSININPVAGFFIMASFLYANNIIAIKMGS